MILRVLVFGPVAAAAGASALSVEVAENATAREVHEAMARSCPPLRSMLPACRLAVNGEYVPPERVVRATDEVAFIGLVSGG
jgi:molybdopterin converting factor small subunit